ncbi:DUF2044 [Nesidiocoris tenuis]|uniref:Mini-chromosome maintenance complex-binding protein n=1 Tax=Nesidiocoris tenuis TaxID=355587 RepID=A0ABN7ANK2_9HEMI|nr:DUF2044 [Nesidiocoris tenuis]
MSNSLTVDAFLADPAAGADLLSRIWEEVPLLDDIPAHSIADGQLLRFRGMVQDMPNPVFYYDHYSVQNSKTGEVSVRRGKYRDGLICGPEEIPMLESDDTTSAERRPFYCVNVPALNSWSRLSSKYSAMPPCSTKRSAEDMDVDDTDASKRLRISNGASNEPDGAAVTPAPVNLHVPIPSDKDRACVIHVYDSTDESLKVNDIIDVVGFAYSKGMDQDCVEVPPSVAPRLHAIALRTLSHVNPLVTIATDRQQVLEGAAALRSELHLALTQLFLGDRLAADFAICHLLANVYARRDIDVCGKFSLNLFNVPVDPAYTSGVYDLLSLLVSKSHFFPMSLENMNTSDLVPVKDYENNRLKSGVLQLSDRTHIVLDETKLEAGKLLERGVKNVQALNTLLTEQTVNYDFKFYNVPFATNIPVLVLSEGKSLLRCDTHVKLVPDSSGCGSIPDTLAAVKAYLKEPLLSSLRVYLTVASTSEFTLPEDMSETIQDDLVAMRQANPQLTPADMHSHVVLARLLALSLGQTRLTKELWEQATRLEKLRRARIV